MHHFSTSAMPYRVIVIACVWTASAIIFPPSPSQGRLVYPKFSLVDKSIASTISPVHHVTRPPWVIDPLQLQSNGCPDRPSSPGGASVAARSRYPLPSIAMGSMSGVYIDAAFSRVRFCVRALVEVSFGHLEGDA